MSSVMQPYAIGNIVTPAIPSSLKGEVHIFLTELTANLNATFNKGKVSISNGSNTGLKGDVKGVDDKGIVKGVSKGASIKASWYGGGGNRISPPNVYVGEMVEVWKVGDSDKYYWRQMFHQPDIRGKELALYAWSNIDREKTPNEVMSPKNSVTLTVSPLTKEIVLKTPKNDEEPAEWELHLDFKKAILEIKNSKGNSLKMTLEDMEFNTKKYIMNAEEVEFNVSKTFKIDTPDATVKGGKLTIDSDTTHSKSTTFNGVTSFNARANINANSFVSKHSVVV